MKVTVDFVEDEVEGDNGPCDGLRATCSHCGHVIEVPGTGDGSRRYAAILFRNECPEGESNYYDVEPYRPSSRHPS